MRKAFGFAVDEVVIDSPSACDTCAGSGAIRVDEPMAPKGWHFEICPDCDGTGKLEEDTMEFKTMNEEVNCSAGLDAKPTGADVNLRDPVAAPDVDGETIISIRLSEFLNLQEEAKRANRKDPFALRNRMCPKCFTQWNAPVSKCPECGADTTPRATEVHNSDHGTYREMYALASTLEREIKDSGAEIEELYGIAGQARHDKKILSAWCYDLRTALKMLLPLAESYLKNAPSSPDNAKLEDARGALAKTHHLEAI